jgi:hypothetical protein
MTPPGRSYGGAPPYRLGGRQPPTTPAPCSAATKLYGMITSIAAMTHDTQAARNRARGE